MITGVEPLDKLDKLESICGSLIERFFSTLTQLILCTLSGVCTGRASPQVHLHGGRDQFGNFGRCLSLPAMFSSKIRLISATVAGFAIRL